MRVLRCAEQQSAKQLDRRRAMRDIRTLFAGLGDLAHRTDHARPLRPHGARRGDTAAPDRGAHTTGPIPRLNNAYAALIEGLYAEVADWIKGWAPKISTQDAKAIATIGVNALLGKRATSTVFRAPKTDMQDEHYIAEWTAMLASRVESLR
jgi:hypothetical protein